MNEKFVEWIRKEIEIRGWTQAELARRSGLSSGSLNNIISGSRNPGIESCTAIAKAMRVKPDFVLKMAGLLPQSQDQPQNPRSMQLLNLFEELSEEHQAAFLELARTFHKAYTKD
ncbi:MAG: helix-turn-helix transcriptional regulator [Anaerolineaceae bacterium]|nr:helix-turn-helix transcriptional regulator [Anaerolineaceae bacterium]